MQHLALLCDNSVVEPHSLPGWILLAEPSEPRAIPEDGPLKDPVSLKESKRRAFAETEKRRISEALQMFNGNRTRAAEYLGISRRSLQLKIKRYRL
jgi:DNA-binding NtrC family response regulator